jgi:hypothetical protein
MDDVDEQDDRRCLECDGTGHVLVPTDDGDVEIVCEACGGSGYL